MTVMRFDPFRDFDRLTEQLFGGARGMRTMPMEAYRRGDQLFIHLDLPAVNPDDRRSSSAPPVGRSCSAWAHCGDRASRDVPAAWR